MSAPSVKVRVTDAEAEDRGVSVSQETLTIAAGGSDTYTVVLDTQPKSTVTITTSDTSDDVTVRPSRAEFSRPATGTAGRR